MAVLCVDIETIADVPEWLIQRWRESIQAPGNYKDPVKIEKYREEALRKRIEKAALSPLTGKVACVGIGYKDAADWEYECFISRSMDERALLLGVDKAIASLPRVGWLVSFNGRKFDFPFLAVRSMKYHLELEHKWPLSKWDRRHVDMFDAFGEGGLGDWGRLLLGEGKTGSGSHVDEMVREGRWEDLEYYCLHDVKLTAGLWDLYTTTTAGGSYGQVAGTG